MLARAPVLLVALAMVAAGCQRGAAPSTRPGPAPGPTATPAPTAESRPAIADPRIPDHPAGECRVDTDCAMLPAIAGCDECPLAPPFEVGTRAELDALLIEAEEQCALEPERETAACPSVSAGCSARAACVDARCSVIAQGC